MHKPLLSGFGRIGFGRIGFGRIGFGRISFGWLLAIALILALVGCGGSSAPDGADSDITDVTVTDANGTDTPADAASSAESDIANSNTELENGSDVSESDASPEGATSSSPPASSTAVSSASTPSSAATAIAATYPEIGVITSAQMGDLMCYLTVEDMEQQPFERGATFDVCDRQANLLNQTVRLVYSTETVADCESAEPCGRSRQATLISDALPLGDSWHILSNGTWTITVGQLDSWDGTNRSGNLTYYGCDNSDSCLALTGGTMTCRDGVCTMAWQNGNYRYLLSSPITEDGSGATTLVVQQNGSEILRADQMDMIVSSDFLN